MPDRPILVFPEAIEITGRARRHSSPPADLILPSPQDQGRRLLPRFRELARKLRDRGLTITSDPAGALPSQILVFELVGTVADFYRVIRRVNGLQWLLDDDKGPTDSGDDFFLPDDPTRKLQSRVLAVSANQTALSELLRLFKLFRRGEKLPRNFGQFTELFAHVRDVRPWEFRDRIEGTGIAEYVEQLARFDDRDLLCSFELFSTGIELEDAATVSRVRSEIDRAHGLVHASVALSQIRHCEIRATIPLRSVPSIAALREIELFHMDDVMFIRPTAQALVEFEEQVQGERDAAQVALSNVSTTPRLALLDGVPVQNHPALANRIILDDPDQCESRAPVNQRVHGTAMASLILNGDLAGDDQKIAERIYVRPILIPRATIGGAVEEIPHDQIPVDVLHRAVARLFEGPDAVARSIRIICLCVADRARPLDNTVSPWARLVDYLSWTYGVLFVLSAGNYPLHLGIPIEDIDPHLVTETQLDEAALSCFVDSASSRPIMSPGEAVNALTIAASGSDASTAEPFAIIPLSREGHLRPALFNAVGYGYRRAVKPELLFRGGRIAFRLSTRSDPGVTHIEAILSLAPPGNEVAAPPRTTAFIRGTSNATAFAGRDALTLLSLIEELEVGSEDRHLQVALLKALMAHSASWGTAFNVLDRILRVRVRPQAVKQNVARYVGYGFPNSSRTRECTDSRVTIVGAGRVESEHALVYRFPLPPAMAAKTVRKRLIITLAYLCPMNPAGRTYRTHNLWATTTFKGEDVRKSLNLTNQQVHEPFLGLGTLQHQILVGSGALAFVDGDGIELQVNCKRDAGVRIASGIPFGFAVTLELLDEVGADIYDQVRARLAVPVEVRAVPIRV